MSSWHTRTRTHTHTHTHTWIASFLAQKSPVQKRINIQRHMRAGTQTSTQAPRKSVAASQADHKQRCYPRKQLLPPAQSKYKIPRICMECLAAAIALNGDRQTRLRSMHKYTLNTRSHTHTHTHTTQTKQAGAENCKHGPIARDANACTATHRKQTRTDAN